MHRKCKYYRQVDHLDCGPTCLRMIASYYGKEYSLEYLREILKINSKGVNLFELSEVAKKVGFKTLSVKLTFDQLIEEASLPCILHWNQEHYVVIYRVKKSRSNFFSGDFEERFVIGDPGHDLLVIDEKTLKEFWLNDTNGKGIALLMEPTDDFYRNNAGVSKNKIKALYNRVKVVIRRFVTQ